jgi:glycosyltransferase involved in cell wall biosynthesis
MLSTSTQEKVSVIIPTYNRARFIANAVESVRNQDYENLEIIIVDDGSNDDTDVVVKRLKKENPFIYYCQNERTKGPSGARNTGILKAAGDHITFLDSDDIWLENHLKDGMDIVQKHPSIDVLFGNFSIYDLNKNRHLSDWFDQKKILHTLKSTKLSPTVRILQDNLFEALIQENFFHLASSIIRRSILKGILFDESIKYSEDRDFAINLFKQSNATFALRNNPVFIAYMHNSNLCNIGDNRNRQEVAEAHLYLCIKYIRIYNLSNQEKKILRKLMTRKLLFLSYLHAKNRKYYNSLSCMHKNFKYYINLKFGGTWS